MKVMMCVNPCSKNLGIPPDPLTTASKMFVDPIQKAIPEIGWPLTNVPKKVNFDAMLPKPEQEPVAMHAWAAFCISPPNN